jgi:hypothetical protein
LTALPSPAGRLEGERRKLSAHALLEARREVYVRRGRRALLARLLATGTATADDVRAAVTLPPDLDARCMGAVPGELASAGIIRPGGYVKTARPVGQARPVLVWHLADRAAAVG